nr:vegetative cell wall protein gp1-like [Aegilops tauschii subsp. strangulata]
MPAGAVPRPRLVPLPLHPLVPLAGRPRHPRLTSLATAPASSAYLQPLCRRGHRAHPALVSAWGCAPSAPRSALLLLVGDAAPSHPASPARAPLIILPSRPSGRTRAPTARCSHHPPLLPTAAPAAAPAMLPRDPCPPALASPVALLRFTPVNPRPLAPGGSAEPPTDGAC